MKNFLLLLSVLALIALIIWGAAESFDSGERCIAAGHSYGHCRIWGVFW